MPLNPASAPLTSIECSSARRGAADKIHATLSAVFDGARCRRASCNTARPQTVNESVRGDDDLQGCMRYVTTPGVLLLLLLQQQVDGVVILLIYFFRPDLGAGPQGH